MSELKMPQVGASRSEIVANWQPENPEFWEKFGKKIAKQNLVISTIALTLSFCVWYLWATIAAQLNGAGFNFTTDQLFTLAALPGLVGATLRFVYMLLASMKDSVHRLVGHQSLDLLSARLDEVHYIVQKDG